MYMKHFILLFALLIPAFSTVFSQIEPDTFSIRLKDTRIITSTDAGYIQHKADAGLIFITDSGAISQIYYASPWIAFFDSLNNLHTNTDIFNSSHSIPGISGDWNNPKWNRFWKIKKSDIEKLQLDFSDGIIDSAITEDIITWPAKGNDYTSNIGITLPDRDIAPFYDQDGDGLYNPFKGDFPLPIKNYQGDLPEFFAWNSFITITGLSIEMRRTIYYFDQEDSCSGANTVYFHVDVYNPVGTFMSGLIGTFMDADIANPYNDACGTDVATNTYYFYNPIEYEKSVSNYNKYILGGSNLPMTTFTWLSHPIKHTIWYMYGAPNEACGAPIDGLESYRLLNAEWLDGSPLRSIDFGYSNNDNIPESKFLFPDLPNTPGGWYFPADTTALLDRRFISSIETGALPRGGTFSYDFCFKTHDYHMTGRPQIEKALDCVQNIILKYKTHIPTVNKNKESPSSHLLNVYPNPATDKIYFSSNDLVEGSVQIFSMAGNKILDQKIDQDLSVNIQSLLPGMYLINIFQPKSKHIFYAKLIVNKNNNH